MDRPVNCPACRSAFKLARALQIEACVHPLKNGRWAHARWSETHAQWQWTKRPAPSPEYVYSISNTLDGLDTNTYASKGAAVRALPAPHPVVHLCPEHEKIIAAELARLQREQDRAEAPAREAARREREEENRRAAEAERARWEREREEALRAHAEEVKAEHERIDAEADERARRHADAFWGAIRPGDRVPAAKDICIVSVETESRRLLGADPKGRVMVYTADVSESGAVHLRRMP